MQNTWLVDWTPEQFSALEEGVLVAKHRLHESGLFSDKSLAELIDTHPADCLHVNTMGTDNNEFQWREGDRAGVSGDVLLDTVRRGRLWLNLRNVLTHHAEFRALVNDVYDELEQNCPGFTANNRSANLLVSSPGALVHYHMDIPVNILWHLRGTKRVWVYPHFDERFVSQDVTERVCSGEFSEDVPYDESFDKYALVFDVQPGEVITWPQHTPHRVTNLDGLNVSLSTEHKNARAKRRINVHLANQFLRRNLALPCRSTNVDGPVAHTKQAISRAVRWYHKLTRQPAEHYTYPVTFRVDPQAPLGYTDLGVAVPEAPHEVLAV